MKLLSDITENVKIIESHGNIDVSVSAISLDSRKIENNSLFVAISGNVVDGHSYIDECVEKGAVVIVHEKDLKEYKSHITYLKVTDTHEAVGFMASNFYGNPSSKLKLVGVTGTSGKTTTATLLYRLFRQLGYKTGMIGTNENKINDETREASRTTPDAVSLNELLAEMVDSGCEYCFMEVSSHAVSEKRVTGLSFVGGIFTNLSLDHLDYHKTIESYAEAKRGFFEMLPSHAFALANIDDGKGEYMLSTTKAKKYTLSLKKPADFNGRIETKLIGEFNAYNVLGIYAVAVLLLTEGKPVLSEVEGIKNKVKEIIKTLETVPGRFQYVKSERGITGIVDYAHKPDALENVLKTVNEMKGNHKLITVVGCGGDRDRSKRPIMARLGYDLSDILILTSDNPRTEKPEAILAEMHAGIEELLQDKVYVIADRHEAISKACSLAHSNDFILVAGKGHENYQEINGVKTHFDDLEELEKYLK